MHGPIQWFSKLLAVFVLLCSVSALADTNIYTCDLDAKSARGWIPSYLVISFLNNGQTAEINYGHKSKNIKVIRYSDKFKSITALTPMKSTNGKSSGTKHYITIFKNRDITYAFKHTGTSEQIIARGKCTAKNVKLSVSSPVKKPVNSSQTSSVDACANGISTCTEDFICKRGFAEIAGKKIWHKSNHAFYMYTVEAKKRGLSCGVASIEVPSVIIPVEVCAISRCNNDTVCKRATVLTVGKKVWRDMYNSNIYVTEAKKRGLSCGVASTKAPPVCSQGQYCSDSFVCSQGTLTVDGKRIWNETPKWEKYVTEAKRRGLSCGVASSSSTTDLNLSNNEICQRASYGVKRKWLLTSSVFYKYVVEAKKRGLSCGVGSSSSTPSIETKVPKVVPSVVPKKKPQIPTKSSPSLIDPLHVTKYGKTRHTALLPKVIFFIGKIEDRDEQDFRRAVRSHDVDTVVLLSDGGLINNGLELANIIFDNNLTTYIPARETCASACSFMFFAGNPKVAHGRLGVHQFYVEDDKEKVEIGKVQKGTQGLVARIITNLTDFGTPPSVFSKMFSTSEMHFFSETEKRSFSDSNKISPETVTRINEVLLYSRVELNDVVLNGMPQEVKSRLIQLELLRIGCMQGPVDGIKGEATTAAIQLLSSKKDSNLSALKFSELFRSLNNTEQSACY